MREPNCGVGGGFRGIGVRAGGGGADVSREYPRDGDGSVRRGSGGREGDGEEYGDEGWFVSFEPRTPQFNLGMVDGTLPMWVRASAFMDYGQRYLIQDVSYVQQTRAEWGAGVAVSANIGNRYDLRTALAWALLDGNVTKAGDFRIFFSISAQF